MQDIHWLSKYHAWYFKIVSKFTRLTAREITYNNFEISLVVYGVFMPNITTNHAITYTNFYEGDIVVDYQKYKETWVWSLNLQYLFTTVHCKNLLYAKSMKTITVCYFYKPVFVVGISVILLFVITVWCSIFLSYQLEKFPWLKCLS